MNQYAHLETDGVYLIREKESDEIALVQVMMETERCIFLLCHGDVEKTYWKKKTDSIYEIIEQLTEDQVTQYENLWTDTDWSSTSWFEENEN